MSKFYNERFKIILHFFIFLLFLFMSAGISESQVSVTFGSSADNTLYEDNTGAISNGAGQYFFTGKTATSVLRRGLISFAIDSVIPPCATIQSVTLRLHMSRAVGTSQRVDLHRVLESWGEGSSDSFGEEGSGTIAEPGDATWIHRFYDTEYWSDTAGTFSSTVSANTNVLNYGFYTWGSTSGMVSDVQSWLNNPSQNFGWCLVTNEVDIQTAKRFDTKETDTVAFIPQLTVTYTINKAVLNLTTLIEGFWDGSQMVRDTVKTFLRGSAAPYAKIDSVKKYLGSNGNGIMCFNNAAGGQYYIVVTHRNSIETWSKLPQSFSIGNVTNYNFTTSATQAFGDNQILKSGKYCIYGGDITQDGGVDLSDIVAAFNDATNFVTGYVNTDVNGDEFVDLTDITIAFNNSTNFVAVIRP